MHLGILSLGIRLVGSEDFLREPLNPSALNFLSELLCTLTSMSHVPHRVVFLDETIRDDRVVPAMRG